MGMIQMSKRLSKGLLAWLACTMLASAPTPAWAQLGQSLGTGTGALLGGDLTDPDDNGEPDADVGYDAVFAGNDEPAFGGGESAFNVFDNIVGGGNDKWCCGVGGGFPEGEGLWVQATLPLPYQLDKFTLTSANDTPGRDPSHWSISGSNDGVNFDTIYEFNGDPLDLWTNRLEVRLFSEVSDFPQQETAYTTFRFSAFDSPNNPNGAYFQIAELEFFGRLGDILLGDFNEDEVIDLADFGILRDNFLDSFPPTQSYPMGDMNGNGKVDLTDFALFREAFAEANPAAAVPEPGSLALVVLGGLAAFGFVRGRTSR